MDDEKKLDLALWRYSIISPLLHRSANDLKLRELLEQEAQKHFVKPDDGTIVAVSAEAMRKWLYRYNHGGLDALADKTRSDKGIHEVPPSLADALFALRQTHPRWTLALMLEELIKQGLWNGSRPCRAVLYRFARLHNLMRDPHLNTVEDVRPFEFDKFGQMWTGDFMHGPKLFLGAKKRKTYLHLIIDDCTRYVVSARFYPAESVESLIKELMTATRRFGIPQCLYTDNGAAYNSRHLKIVCANLGMRQPHTPPRRPQGRSKVERFFRTIREQFLSLCKYKTFEQINLDLARYLDEYHHRLHSGIQCTPMQKRMSVDAVCRKVPEVTDIQALFRINRRCRVYNDGTVRLHKKSFEVPGCLPGSRVTVHYMPWDLSQVYYGDDMCLAKEVDLVANAHRFDHPNFKGGRS